MGVSENSFVLLSEINKFENPEEMQRLSLISKKIGISKQSLNYYLKKLSNVGLITRTQSSPFSIYVLTEKGRAVKENLVHSEESFKTNMWRFHNLLLGFNIRSFGTWKFQETKSVKMMNWFYQQVQMPGGHAVHIQSTGLLKIYCPEMVGDDPEIMRGKAHADAQEVARHFIDKYDMLLEPMRILRKGEKELLGSGDLAKLFGRMKTPDLFINASGGEENLEEKEDSNRIEDLIAMPEKMEELKECIVGLQSAVVETMGNKLNPTLEALAKQIELHLEVMRNINAGISELRGALPNQSGISQKTRDFEAHDKGSVEVQFVRETPRLGYQFKGGERMVGPFQAGMRMFFPRAVAEEIVSDGFASYA
jgi:DNA-binding HxlR family transcriptional regulator